MSVPPCLVYEISQEGDDAPAEREYCAQFLRRTAEEYGMNKVVRAMGRLSVYSGDLLFCVRKQELVPPAHGEGSSRRVLHRKSLRILIWIKWPAKNFYLCLPKFIERRGKLLSYLYYYGFARFEIKDVISLLTHEHKNYRHWSID